MTFLQEAKSFLKKWLPSILFNLALIAIVFQSAALLGLTKTECFLICMVWSVCKLSIGEPKHYKAWQLCLIWTNVVFLSFFRLETIHIVLSCVCAIFTAYTLSGKANIKETKKQEDVTMEDISQWKQKKESKYQKELDFVRYNPSAKSLMELESRLKQEDDTFTYLCFKYIFKDGYSWQKTAEMLDTDTNRLTPIVDKIAFTIRMFCKI